MTDQNTTAPLAADLAEAHTAVLPALARVLAEDRAVRAILAAILADFEQEEEGPQGPDVWTQERVIENGSWF